MEKPSRVLANSSTALDQLRGLINQHESTPGTPLPTERELSETLGVGRREVRRALDVLEADLAQAGQRYLHWSGCPC